MYFQQNNHEHCIHCLFLYQYSLILSQNNVFCSHLCKWWIYYFHLYKYSLIETLNCYIYILTSMISPSFGSLISGERPPEAHRPPSAQAGRKCFHGCTDNKSDKSPWRINIWFVRKTPPPLVFNCMEHVPPVGFDVTKTRHPTKEVHAKLQLLQLVVGTT